MYAISRLRAKDAHRTHKSSRVHKSYTYAISRLRTKVVFSTQRRLKGEKAVQYTYADRHVCFQQINNIFKTSAMERGEQDKSTRINRDWTKTRKGIAAPL